MRLSKNNFLYGHGGSIPGYSPRTQRRMSRAHEKASEAGEEPIMYRTVRGPANPRFMSQASERIPVYADERRIQNEADYKAAKKEGNRVARELAQKERQRGRNMRRAKHPNTRGIALRDLFSKDRSRANYGGKKARGLSVGFLGWLENKEKERNCRLKGNCW